MELRWTVLDTHRAGASTDVAVTAAAGTTFDAVAQALRASTGHMHHAGDVHVGGAPVHAHAVLGLPPLLDGAVVVLEHPEGRADVRRRAGPSLLEVHVVAGPDAGLVATLPPGVTTVGRSAEAGVRIRDPELSRVHAELEVRADGVWVRDLGSTNGTRVRGTPVGDAAVRVGPDHPVRLGLSTVRVRQPGQRPAVLRPDGRGHLLVHRPPVLDPPAQPPEVTYPQPPSAGRPARLPWPAMFLPLLVSVPLAVLWRQPTFLLFAAMTPVMLLGQHVADRRSGRRQRLEENADYEREVAAADEAVGGAMADELARLETEVPDLAHVRAVARVPADELWSRRPGKDGSFELRLGRGRRTSRVVVRRPAAGRSRSAGEGDHETVTAHPDAPVVVDLAAVRVLGIAGPRAAALAVARSLIGQLAVRCSPLELRIRVLAGDAARTNDWAWSAWLPHTDHDGPPVPPAGDGRRTATTAHRVVVADGVRAPRERAAVAALLRHGEDAGVMLVHLDDEAGMLPVTCGATVVVDDVPAVAGGASGSTATYRRADAEAVTVELDLPAQSWAEDVARSLAPLRDEAPDAVGELPAELSYAVLMRAHGLEVTDARAILARWSTPGARTGATATIGVGGSGPCTIDLTRDGPHALIGGTTGSGKSELLRTLVVALAVEHPPDAVSFVLVDYKGGAAFRECERLPHVAGVVTDLDNALAARALTSLRAELRRRERLLARAGASDLTAYAARPRQGPLADLPPLPRLVIVVDEFRVLAEELPDFVSGLVRIAAVGRSLGVHLVLATQRPAGVVSADIRANTNLRIALRVRDRADSEDVVDGPQAAALPADSPGRAVLRAGGETSVVLQVARLSGATSREDPSVVRLDRTLRPASGDPRTPSASRDVAHRANRTSGAEQVVTAVREAAARRGVPPARAPWLPPLATEVRLEELLPGAGHPDVVLGIADDPDNQRQADARWRLRGRHLAVAGGPRSGRSTCLRTLVVAAMHRRRATHVYGVDASGELLPLAGLPHVGAVVTARDVERVERLFRRLQEEIAQRRRETAARPDGDHDRPDEMAGRADIVLAVDGWELAVEAWAAYRHGRLIDDLLAILRDGGSAGIHVAVTGERAVLSGAPSALLTDRILLRFADPLTAALAGVPVARLPAVQPPGRGLWLPADEGIFEVQIATAPAHPPDAADAARRRRSAPWPVPELPDRLARRTLADGFPPAADDHARGALLVGLAVEDRPSAATESRPYVAVGPDAVPGAVLSVLGPPGSGRSTALAALAAAAHEADLDPVLVANGAPVAAIPAGAALVDTSRPDAADVLDVAVSRARRPVVLVDDAGDLGDDLGQLVLATLPRAPVVVAASATDVLGSYGGLLGAARKARSGLFLGAVRAGDGEALGVRLDPAPAGPPGRGRLVRRGRVVAVQVAEPESVVRHEGLARRPVAAQ